MDITLLSSHPILQQVLPAAAAASALAIAQAAPLPAVAEAPFQLEVAALVANAQVHEAELTAVDTARTVLAQTPATAVPDVQAGVSFSTTLDLLD